MTRRKLVAHMLIHEVRHLAQVAFAARVYQTCGYIYYEAETLPRCMRELIPQRHWLDLVPPR